MSNNYEALRISLRTSRDMIFRVNGDIVLIRKHTKCEKVPYTNEIKRYLKNMEKKSINRPNINTKAVCIKLKGALRYVWRSDVFTEKEYDEIRKKERHKISRVFGQKREGAMVSRDIK